jgi:serine/threonine protein kinase
MVAADGSILDIGILSSIGMALCAALDRLLAAGILHRDIKPSNIGYTLDRVPKLLDLVLAKFIPRTLEMETASGLGTQEVFRAPAAPTTGDQSATLAGHIVGTLAYFSPQALQGRRRIPSSTCGAFLRSSSLQSAASIHLWQAARKKP